MISTADIQAYLLFSGHVHREGVHCEGVQGVWGKWQHGPAHHGQVGEIRYLKQVGAQFG